ncbi:alpha-L-fucosidase-domain-containing protein [Phascolomyces articulosus]|uniref:alpha-L-fucosidase n=1 Tax=Phascolomyces articulosus TaxID=60185 RepID=A0AAD5JR57_9FUNG|nr:alpha-L-fucosidase-domain-containing protein [Phascolomyces articulosus]
MSVLVPGDRRIAVDNEDDRHDHFNNESTPLLSSTSSSSAHHPRQQQPYSYDSNDDNDEEVGQEEQLEKHFITKRRLMAIGFITTLLITCLVLVWAAPPSTTETQLYPWLNNRGCGSKGDFDTQGNAFALEKGKNNTIVPVPGSILSFHTHIGETKDNVAAQGQTIPLVLPESTGALYLLVSSSFGPVPDAEIIIQYHDSTKSISRIDVPDWQESQLNQVLDRTLGIPWKVSNGNTGAFYVIPVYVNPSKRIRALQLPKDDRVHVFAIQPLGPNKEKGGAHIVSARPAQLWDDQGRQIIRIRIHNTSPETIKDIQVSIQNGGGQALIPRLAPGHFTMVNVGVSSPSSTTTTSITIDATHSESVSFELNLGLIQYDSTKASLQQHQAPQWLEDAKFGIFIHWGLYSVPAWAPVGKEYSEWYWWQMSHEPTYSHHRDTYGEQFNYDDFIPQLPSTPDPSKWLDLISKSRARYFVFTTKHHDGFALWDTKVNERSSVKLGPKRDFVDALMTAAKQPAYSHLKRGLYFSMPEWYHPEYNDESLGWHGPPKNPYTGKTIPYTGYNPPIQDFVNEVQVPQAMELIEQHEPDIFWCDIGGINNSSAWQVPFFNKAASKQRQVSVNDRCGNGISDFTTVEYKPNANAPSRFWEATRGIDPYSFGYNQATQPSQYATTQSLLQELVDVVSKGGNLLLNFGPDMHGNVAEPMEKALIDMGNWIDQVGPECLFNTTRYWVAPSGIEQDKIRLRFTISEHAFYMFALDKPPQGAFTIPVPVPKIESGIETTTGVQVPWHLDAQGQVVLQFSKQAIDANQHVWVFKMT